MKMVMMIIKNDDDEGEGYHGDGTDDFSQG